MSLPARRSWLRTGLVSLLATVLTTVLASIAAPAAHAACTPATGLGDLHITEDKWLYVFDIDSVTETILPSEVRFAQNATDLPASVTFTTTVSKTFTFSANFNYSFTSRASIVAQVLEHSNTFGIGFTVSTSTTTLTGVSVTATVSPHTSVTGQYGVRAYNMEGTRTTFFKDTCVQQPVIGVTHSSMTVVTTDKGWRISQTPL